ncbi:hypothetical protein SCA6_013985 [Theobroma cacao]
MEKDDALMLIKALNPSGGSWSVQTPPRLPCLPAPLSLSLRPLASCQFPLTPRSHPTISIS